MADITAFLLIFAGVLLFAFSFVLKFKPISFEDEQQETKFEEEAEEDVNDDDFRMLLDSGKAFIRLFAAFIAVIGVIIYIL